MTTRFSIPVLLLATALLVSGCAAAQAIKQGDDAVKAGDLDAAVGFYRKAAQEDPDNANTQITLQRTMQAASRAHLDRAREYETQNQLEAARGEYRLATEFDPSNRLAEAKVAALDRAIRDQIEATRPRPFEEMQARARASSPIPILNPASRDPIALTTNNTPLRDVLNAIANSVGITITYDRDLENSGSAGILRPTSVQLEGVTIDQALNQVLSVNQLAYKVVTARSILIFQDTAQKHAQYDDQVIQTFQISHSNPTELVALISQLVRPVGVGVQPLLTANPTSNTIVAKATVQMMQIIERVIDLNDKPPAEVVIDVQILEVNRTRAKQYGLNLSEYAIGGVLSPEVSPGQTSTTTSGTGGQGTGGAQITTTQGQSTPPSGLLSPPPFNLNTISRGFSSSDFYLAVPTALVRFLESDSQTKVVAKPQLRGTEGTKLLLRLGDKVPLPSTTFTPLATGGASTNPLTTFTYTDVGVNLDLTPRVTVEGDIILDLVVENSSLGGNIVVNGVSSPTIGTRSVTSRLRLRDGESNLLAGLLREDERRSLSGFPGAIHVPLLKQLFSNNDNSISQTDIVMLLTPHIVRTKEITEADLRPLYLGAGSNWALGGPPPLIDVANAGTGAPAAPVTAAPPAGAPAGGFTIGPPPGSSPVPGTIATPILPQPAPPATAPAPNPTPTQTAPPAPASQPLPPVQPQTPVQTSPPGAANDPNLAPASPVTTPGVGSALIVLTPPAAPFRVGGGPYNVPITVSNASRLSMVVLTVAFDATKLRVRSVQEGPFMRSGGAIATFTQQVGNGRIDITILRSNDAVGATGAGLLGSVLFEAIAPGMAPLTLSGTATGPGGTPMGLQMRPVTINVQP